MKHILLSALLVASLPALAQTEKGKIMVGVSLADISAGIVKGGSAVDYVSLTINPRVGYFVADNLVIGTALNLGLGKSHDFTVLNYGLHPFGRYYFGSKKTRLFAEAGAGFFVQDVISSPAIDHTSSMFTFAVGPGLAHFLNDNVAIETSLMFRGISNTEEMNRTYYQPSLSFGFQIYLNGFKKVKPVPVPVVEEE
jgi:hypothetical protein